MRSFNKDFFHFLSGFMGLVCISLIIIFIVGFYETEVLGVGLKGDAAAPTPITTQ
jgi:hypothetical protein